MSKPRRHLVALATNARETRGPRRCPSRGFSLLELLISLSVIGLLLGLAVPGFADYRSERAMQGARERLFVSLWLARSKALELGRATVLCGSADGLRCDGSGEWAQGWIVFVDRNRNRQFDAGETLLERVEALPAGIRAYSGQGRSRIRYNPMGYSPGTNLTISFCDQRGASHASLLVVSNTGRPRQVRDPGSARCG